MPTGAFSSCTVPAGGLWPTLVFSQPPAAGWAGTYTENEAKRPAFTVVSPVPDGGTVTRTIGISRIVSTTVNGTDLEVVVDLDEPIYTSADETLPKVTTTEGWLTDTSGDVSGATAATAITNSSTLDYPRPFAAWWVPPQGPPEGYAGVFGNSELEHPLGIVGKSPHGIKKVVFTFTPAVGDAVVETVTTPTKSSMSWTLIDRNRTFILADHVYLPTTSASAFADGLVTMTAEVFPNVAASDRTRTTSTEADDYFDALPIYANSGGTLTQPRVFVGSGGSDSADGTSWANRVLTMDKAFEKVDGTAGGGGVKDGAIIEFGPGTYTAVAFLGNANFSAMTRYVTLQPSYDNGGTRTNVILQMKAQQHGLRFLRIRDVTLDHTVANEVNVWTATTEPRNIWMDKVFCTTSNAGGRDAAVALSPYASSSWTKRYVTNCIAYDYPSRPWPESTLRRGCHNEKTRLDAVLNCIHVFMDLTYDLHEPVVADHPDYYQSYKIRNNTILSSFIGLDFTGQPIFIGPTQTPGTNMSFWFGNGLLAQTENLDLTSQIIAGNGINVSVEHAVFINITMPNGRLLLAAETGSGTVTHSNTWYVGNEQNNLSNGDEPGVIARDSHSHGTANTDGTSYGFTTGDPGFANGAYNADFNANSTDYRLAPDSALRRRITPSLRTIDAAGNPIDDPDDIGYRADTPLGLYSIMVGSVPLVIGMEQ